VVLTIPEDFRHTTANLLAPIIINSENLQAMQYIAMKSSYTTRHPIFKLENKAAAAGEGR
jgi:flagellar assembly factor FliW